MTEPTHPNWHSEEARALLRRAFPAGFLPVRGVLTLGGFLVTAVEKSKHSRRRVTFQRGSNGAIVFERRRGDFFGNTGVFTNAAAWAVLRRGSLLPLPDATDPATWACLLAELHRRLVKDRDPESPLRARPIWGYAVCRNIRGKWIFRRDGDLSGAQWWLQARNEKAGLPKPVTPEEALVYALASFRQEVPS